MARTDVSGFQSSTAQKKARRPGGSGGGGSVGITGTYYSVTTVQNTQLDFTGSNAGTWGSVMTGHASAAGTITLTRGGTVAIGSLTKGVQYGFSPIKVVESGNQPVYVFKKAQVQPVSDMAFELCYDDDVEAG